MCINILAESEKFKVYSLSESVYLKDKSSSKSINDYEKNDFLLAWVYGDPDSALISSNQSFIAISGCGIILYFLESKKIIELYNAPEDIMWTNSIKQNIEDEEYIIRFNALTDSDKINHNKLNVKSLNLETTN